MGHLTDFGLGTAPKNLQCCRSQLTMAHGKESQADQVNGDGKLIKVKLNTH